MAPGGLHWGTLAAEKGSCLNVLVIRFAATQDLSVLLPFEVSKRLDSPVLSKEFRLWQGRIRVIVATLESENDAVTLKQFLTKPLVALDVVVLLEPLTCSNTIFSALAEQFGAALWNNAVIVKPAEPEAGRESHGEGAPSYEDASLVQSLLEQLPFGQGPSSRLPLVVQSLQTQDPDQLSDLLHAMRGIMRGAIPFVPPIPPRTHASLPLPGAPSRLVSAFPILASLPTTAASILRHCRPSPTLPSPLDPSPTSPPGTHPSPPPTWLRAVTATAAAAAHSLPTPPPALAIPVACLSLALSALAPPVASLPGSLAAGRAGARTQAGMAAHGGVLGPLQPLRVAHTRFGPPPGAVSSALESLGSSLQGAGTGGGGSAAPVRVQQRTWARTWWGPGAGPANPEPRKTPGAYKAAIVWFRSDLRTHDHEALQRANESAVSVLPVYCFDPRDYGKSPSGFDKTGPYRARFVLESVANLRKSLRALGSELIVRVGKPEEVLPALARAVGADALFSHLEITRQDVQSEANVTAAVKDAGLETHFSWGSTLIHLEDLPFTLPSIPSTYGSFKKALAHARVRPALPAPRRLRGLPPRGRVAPGEVPTLLQLGLSPQPPPPLATSMPPRAGPAASSKEAAWELIGGEDEALKHVGALVAELRAGGGGGTGRGSAGGGGCGGANFTERISSWLAQGCLSPRRMLEDLRKASGHTGPVAASASLGVAAGAESGSLDWLVFELLWRDFFRFITRKYSSMQSSRTALPQPLTAAAVAS